jgi:sulfinoalanine decarboxylase/sulfinoalanine decarboxylase/aspartate 1-decarboxylase
MIKEELNKFRALSEALLEAEQREPVVEPIEASRLFEAVDLGLQQEGISDEELYRSLEDLVMKTPRTATRQFFNQLFGGRKAKAVLGDLVAVMLNNSMYTYKVAGPMVGVEKEVLRQVSELVGYGNQADGTIAPGGSMSNFMAMVMARDAFKKDIRHTGVTEKMTLYTSAACHYSIAKNAALMGVGREQVRFIPTDEKGVMLMDALDAQITKDKEDGFTPFFINVTAGTTVMGAFDPVDEAATIAKNHKLWLHVDGAYCGAVIFSKKYKHLVKGAELADSFSVNAHKMLGTPLTCSIILAKDKRHLSDSFSSDARYLYQTDGDDYNLGKTSLQCGRRNDALKFWTLWKSIGTNGLEKMVDHQFHLAEVARNYIQEHKDYKLYSYGDSISVCFNYKNIAPEKLCTALYEKAELMVGYGTFQADTFVRFVTINADNSDKEIIEFFKTLEKFVDENESSLIEEENN